MIIEVEGEDAGSLDVMPQVSWTRPFLYLERVCVVVSGRNEVKGAGATSEWERMKTRLGRLVRTG